MASTMKYDCIDVLQLWAALEPVFVGVGAEGASPVMVN